MKIVAFVPIKLNNERLPNKNLKAFDNGKPLLLYTLETLLKVRGIDSCFVYCSSESIKNILPESVTFLKRSEALDKPTATGNDLSICFAREVDADVYIKLHVTTPFIEVSSVECALNAVLNEGYDSAFPVTTNYEFMWVDGKPNYDTQNIPRTQDLIPFHVETTGFYVYKREVIEKYSSRIGKRPFMLPVSKVEAIDIDNPIDFEIANAVYNHIIKTKD